MVSRDIFVVFFFFVGHMFALLDINSTSYEVMCYIH